MKELCAQYGAVEAIVTDGPGAFIASFASAEAARNACPALEGLSLENDGGSHSIVQARLLPERREGDPEERSRSRDSPARSRDSSDGKKKKKRKGKHKLAAAAQSDEEQADEDKEV